MGGRVMKRITDYTIVNGEDSKAMTEDAMEHIADGWEPLGGCMPNNYMQQHWDPNAGAYFSTTFTTYTQTYVKREE